MARLMRYLDDTETTEDQNLIKHIKQQRTLYQHKRGLGHLFQIVKIRNWYTSNLDSQNDTQLEILKRSAPYHSRLKWTARS